MDSLEMARELLPLADTTTYAGNAIKLLLEDYLNRKTNGKHKVMRTTVIATLDDDEPRTFAVSDHQCKDNYYGLSDDKTAVAFPRTKWRIATNEELRELVRGISSPIYVFHKVWKQLYVVTEELENVYVCGKDSWCKNDCYELDVDSIISDANKYWTIQRTLERHM